ncbi:MAG: tRNA 2-selenouridine(34) synthase MnmH [Bacteroidetes bacterium]|nr:MAG: tRNA 2-selenouridine(34) synthase MnmH [Bacteroidota bacterium]
MVQQLSIEAFLAAAQNEGLPILDVRSPGEYHKGHIPHAHSLPLFSNEERKTIGIIYKKRGREAAVDHGLGIVGPRLTDYVTQARQIAPQKRILTHCWRGGMRSESLAMLWNAAGLEVGVLKGGYKSYRNWVLEQLRHTGPLIILGGKTGSGKTHVLYALARQGEQIIDLEGLAHHKGSAFGAIGEAPQPTVEQFENDLHQQLTSLQIGRRIWVEDESHYIGKVYVPQPFWERMKAAPVLALDVSLEARVQTLVQDYTAGGYDDADFAKALDRIKKRLGGEAHKAALAALAQKDYETAATLALRYYDKTYPYGLSRKNPLRLHHIPVTDNDPDHIADLLIRYANTHLFPA